MDALFSCFKEAIGVLKRRKVWLIVFGATILLGIILGVVLSKPAAIRQYYAVYCRAYTDMIFAASVFKLFFKRLIAGFIVASDRSVVFHGVLSSRCVSDCVFQRVHVRDRCRDFAFFFRRKRLVYLSRLCVAVGCSYVCTACDCLCARHGSMQKTTADVRIVRRALLFFIAFFMRRGVRDCGNAACGADFSPDR